MSLETLLITVNEACRLVGLGRTKVYALIAAGEIETVQIGRARRIKVESLRRLAEGEAGQ